ncbi:hydroxylamine reductase, partial [Candidatus Bipolaricaulota bacterium]|nr:hydroxylamine reductase [Candidatus Bipolaricaulota bacterium]
MFCYQCEQTKNGVGCTTFGICGKDPTTAALQDVLLYVAKGISMYAHRARQLGAVDAEIDRFTIHALFTTVTNVNFDSQRLEGLIRQALDLRARARSLYETACQTNGKDPESLSGPAGWDLGSSLREWLDQQKVFSIDARKAQYGEDVVGLQELLVYGLKGAAAYVDHAQILGIEDEAVWPTFHEMLDYLASDPTDINELTGMCLRCGEMNLRVMELLDKAHTSIYGIPEPTAVRIEPLAGKAILISGHDLKDLEELLVQTQGRGINVYTHGEMLPCNAYPELKKYSHFVGNYGGAWQDQHTEFDAFPGSIVMTTNCIQRPKDSYKDRIFTLGLVAWPGVKHISDGNFAPVIDAALAAPGFGEDAEEKKITIGFARNAVMSVAGPVIEAVKAGNIKHFFLIGG